MSDPAGTTPRMAMTLAVGVLCVVLGALGAWLVARREHEGGRRAVEVELATARSQLAARDDLVRRLEQQAGQLRQQEEQLSALLTTTRADFARADADGRSLAGQVEQLRAELGARASSLTASQQEASAARAQLAGAQAQLVAAHDRREAVEAQLAHLEGVERRAQHLAEALARAESQLDAERARTVERAAETARGREVMRLEFEALAQKLLEEKGKAMLEQGHKDLEGLLAPVKERLVAFEETINKTYQQENRDRATLLESLRSMSETQARLHADAEALARALTGESKAQGDWGELVLERLLESAGLTEGREYQLQVDHRDEDGGARRPDALVYLPQNRAVVIDAKCSLSAFIAATRANDDAEREVDLDAHLASVRAHVKTLQKKDYAALLAERSLDVTFMFLPNEAAFHAALSRAPRLFEEAFAQGVVLCSPTTLLAALQVVNHVWRSERQAHNAERIAEAAGKMVDKLALAVEAFDEVGKRLDGAQEAWARARGRLGAGPGNVLTAAHRLVELGARVRKQDKLDAATRAMDADRDDDAPEALGAGAQPVA